MEILCLKRFDNISEFNNFTNQLTQIHWKIEKQLLKERAFKYSNLMIFKELKNEYIKKKISIFQLKDEEVVTWLDTMLIMKRVFSNMYELGTLRPDLTLLMEYPFLFGNYMRTDYLLIYKDLIVSIELGMFNQDEKRKEERYTKKVQETIGHKHVLTQMLTENVTINSYVIIYKPEFDRNFSASIKENIEYNNLEIKKLSQFLELQLRVQDQKMAIQQLLALESHR